MLYYSHKRDNFPYDMERIDSDNWFCFRSSFVFILISDPYFHCFSLCFNKYITKFPALLQDIVNTVIIMFECE